VKAVLYIVGAPILLVLLANVLASLAADLSMLVEAFGPWGAAIFFAVPMIVFVGGSLIGDRR
jgi:hypothetical protein